MRWLEDSFHRRIRLTPEREEHFASEHPEMTGQIEKICETLLQPNMVIRSKTDSQAELFYRFFNKTPVTSKYLCVIIKSAFDDLYILTAYFTDTIKRGEIIWEKS